MQIGIKEREEMRLMKSLRAKIIPFICKLDALERQEIMRTIPKIKFGSSIVSLCKSIDKVTEHLFEDIPQAQLMPESEHDIKLAYQWLFQEILIKLAENGSTQL